MPGFFALLDLIFLATAPAHAQRSLVICERPGVIDALPDAIGQAKTVFPGAKFVAPATDRSWVRNGDAIPFGDA